MAHINQNYLKLPGSYLFSDVELVAAPAAVEEPSVEVPTVDVTNPATGAAC